MMDKAGPTCDEEPVYYFGLHGVLSDNSDPRERQADFFSKVNHAHATLQYGMRHFYDSYHGMRSKKTTSSA